MIDNRGTFARALEASLVGVFSRETQARYEKQADRREQRQWARSRPHQKIGRGRNPLRPC